MERKAANAIGRGIGSPPPGRSLGALEVKKFPVKPQNLYAPSYGRQFAIIWQGSLSAQDSGFYEFRIKTQNGVRLYLNNDSSQCRRKLRDDSSVAGQSALIDGWVSSGKMREHRTGVGHVLHSFQRHHGVEALGVFEAKRVAAAE